MSAKRRKSHSGFTLVEILIVVVILGILAAIVIPQFTNASGDARTSSLTSQLQTIRSQIELYKIQHNDALPSNLGTNWSQLTGQTDINGNTGSSAVGTLYGPYLQQPPVNPLNNLSGIGASPSASTGWVYISTGTSTYTIEPTSADAVTALNNY